MRRPFFFIGIPLAMVGVCCAAPEEGRPVKLTGKVRSYQSEKRIGIDIQPQVEKTYDLTAKDCTYVLDPAIQVGSNVEAEEKKDETGKKIVIIRIRQ